MKKKQTKLFYALFLLTCGIMTGTLFWILWECVPRAFVRYSLLAICGGIAFLNLLWSALKRRQIEQFSDDLCETLDAAIAGRQPEYFQPYEDSLTAKVQGKLLQYYDIMQESRNQSQHDKEILQGLVSDISHQIKTPVANMKLYSGILQKQDLTEEKRQMFAATLEEQINKLDFLIQSLLHMSRLETGTFVLHPKKCRLHETIALAMSAVWGKAEQKGIELSVECDPEITVQHDPKWTAEAIGNILDNAVKYTPFGGCISIKVRPWQFYTRIDISDTGMGIEEKHYQDVFQRFYRAEVAAAQEGVGLGLYLANGIINRQKGYISVKSKLKEGTTFSVYLLS